MKQPFSTPGFLWPLLTLICVIILLSGLNGALKRTGWPKEKKQKIFLSVTCITVVWIALLTILSYKGVFSDFSKLPPRPAIVILLPLPFVILFAFSKTGTQLLQATPKQWPIFMQSFRILVELLIWFAFLADKLPIQMTFEGRNFDVLTGMLALPTGYFLLKKTPSANRLAIIFNIVGILLLLNILVVALLSMPTSIRHFMNEPSSSIVATFPFILLPGVLVPIAYSMHIFSLRQLLYKEKR